MKLPYDPRLHDLTLEDIRGVVDSWLSGPTRDVALKALVGPWPHRRTGEYPAPASGGPNNIDHASHGVLRARIAKRSGDRELAEQSLGYARGWLENAYHRVARDEAHRYLEGALAFLALAAGRSSSDDYNLARSILRQAYARDDMGLAKLREYRNAEFSNLRIIARACANCAVGAEALREDDPEKAAELLAVVDDALRWFFSLRWSPPVTDEFHGERPGWGVDASGVAFHADQLGKTDLYWSRIRTSVWMPWQVFFLLPNAIRAITYLALDDLSIHSFALVKNHMGELVETWRRRAYHDADDPHARGMGPTRAHSIFRDARKPIIARPTELDLPTGNMLWSPFWLVRDEKDAARMLEALVVQGEAHWPDWPVMLWGVDFLRRVAESAGVIRGDADVDPIPEPNPVPPTREERRARLARAHEVLTDAGLGHEAEFLRDHVDAAEKYMRATN